MNGSDELLLSQVYCAVDTRTLTLVATAFRKEFLTPLQDGRLAIVERNYVCPVTKIHSDKVSPEECQAKLITCAQFIEQKVKEMEHYKTMSSHTMFDKMVLIASELQIHVTWCNSSTNALHFFDNSALLAKTGTDGAYLQSQKTI